MNSQTIDRWCASGWEWGKPITHEEFLDAGKGKWKIVLTPTKTTPRNWIGNVNGKRVLGLASGGGQQMPILAALGACCTVLDYSDCQLASEQMVADREGYKIEIIKHDMSKPLPFGDGTFDLIVHPVSNVYIEKVEPLFKECYRILKNGGVLIAGLDNGVNFVTNDEITIENRLPFNPLKNESQLRLLQKNDDGIQFSHTLEEQIGGQLEAGFILKEIYVDTNGSGRLHELNIPTFFATKAVKQ